MFDRKNVRHFQDFSKSSTFFTVEHFYEYETLFLFFLNKDVSSFADPIFFSSQKSKTKKIHLSTENINHFLHHRLQKRIVAVSVQKNPSSLSLLPQRTLQVIFQYFDFFFFWRKHPFVGCTPDFLNVCLTLKRMV